jgi:hypothetical protein
MNLPGLTYSHYLPAGFFFHKRVQVEFPGIKAKKNAVYLTIL